MRLACTIPMSLIVFHISLKSELAIVSMADFLLRIQSRNAALTVIMCGGKNCALQICFVLTFSGVTNGQILIY